MGHEIFFGIGAIILLAAMIWGVMRSSRLSPEDKRPGDAVAHKRYEQNDG